MSDDEKYAVAIELAKAIVQQWDQHDKFRVVLGDELLWKFNEPDEVFVARTLINADKTYGCELRDPYGTIWQYAAALRDELRAVLNEGLTEERCSNARRLVSER